MSEQARGYIVTGREYRILARGNRFECTKCECKCSTWSWDNDDPYSDCCKAPIRLAQDGGQIYYKGEVVDALAVAPPTGRKSVRYRRVFEENLAMQRAPAPEVPASEGGE